jgi:hypothetical protein
MDGRRIEPRGGSEAITGRSWRPVSAMEPGGLERRRAMRDIQAPGKVCHERRAYGIFGLLSAGSGAPANSVSRQIGSKQLRREPKIEDKRIERLVAILRRPAQHRRRMHGGDQPWVDTEVGR